MRYYRCRRGRRNRPRSEGYEIDKGRGRPLKEILIEDYPKITKFIPEPKYSDKELELSLGEFEAIRLVDYEGLNQEEAGELMNVSRGTIWRLLNSGRKKIIEAILQGKTLFIENISQK